MFSITINAATAKAPQWPCQTYVPTCPPALKHEDLTPQQHAPIQFVYPSRLCSAFAAHYVRAMHSDEGSWAGHWDRSVSTLAVSCPAGRTLPSSPTSLVILCVFIAYNPCPRPHLFPLRPCRTPSTYVHDADASPAATLFTSSTHEGIARITLARTSAATWSISSGLAAEASNVRPTSSTFYCSTSRPRRSLQTQFHPNCCRTRAAAPSLSSPYSRGTGRVPMLAVVAGEKGSYHRAFQTLVA